MHMKFGHYLLTFGAWFTIPCVSVCASDGAFISPEAEDVRLVINSLPLSYHPTTDPEWNDIVKSLKSTLSLMRSESKLVESRSIFLFDLKLLAAVTKAISDLPELKIINDGKIGEVVFSPAELRNENSDFEATLLGALAEIYFRTGEWDKSESYFRETIALVDKTDIDYSQRLTVGLAKVLRRKAKFEEAEKLLTSKTMETITNKAIESELDEELLCLNYDRHTHAPAPADKPKRDMNTRLRPEFRSAYSVDLFGKKVASLHKQGESELDAEAKAIKGLVFQRLPSSIGKRALDDFLSSERAKELERRRERREELRKEQLAALLDEILGIRKVKQKIEEERERARKEEDDWQRNYLHKQQELEEKRIEAERERMRHQEEQQYMNDWNAKNRQITGTSYFSRYKN